MPGGIELSIRINFSLRSHFERESHTDLRDVISGLMSLVIGVATHTIMIVEFSTDSSIFVET